MGSIKVMRFPALLFFAFIGIGLCRKPGGGKPGFIGKPNKKPGGGRPGGKPDGTWTSGWQGERGPGGNDEKDGAGNAVDSKNIEIAQCDKIHPALQQLNDSFNKMKQHELALVMQFIRSIMSINDDTTDQEKVVVNGH